MQILTFNQEEARITDDSAVRQIEFWYKSYLILHVVSMFKLRKPIAQPHRLPSKHCLHLCGNISTILVLNSLPKFPKNPHHIAI